MSSRNKNIKKLNQTRRIKRFTYPLIHFLDKTGIQPFFVGIINSLLRVLKIKKQLNPQLNYKSYSSIFKSAFYESKKRQKTVVFPFAMGTESTYNLRQMMLAKYLEKKGFSSNFIICDGILSICHKERIGKTKDNTSFMCHECSNNYSYIKDKTGLNITYLSDLAEDIKDKEYYSEKNRIEALISVKEATSFTTKSGVPLGDLTTVSVLRFFMKGHLEYSEYELEIFKRFLINSLLLSKSFAEYALKNNFDLMVLWNGSSNFDKIAAFYAQKKEVDFVTQECYIGSNSWIYKKNDIAIHLDFYKDFLSEKESFDYGKSEKKVIESFFEDLAVGKKHAVKMNAEGRELSELGDDSYAVLFTNMNFDTYVLGRNPLFTSMKEWIIETIDYWNKNVENTKLIIRAHPGEEKLLTYSNDFVRNFVLPRLTDKIIFFDANETVNSYDLLDKAKYVLTYSSTIGVEALLKGIPNLIAGDCLYKDFALRSGSKKGYFELVQKLNDQQITHNTNLSELKHYLYYLYYIRTEQLQGFDIDRAHGKAVFDKSITHEELIHLNNKSLDRFYDRIIG